MHFFEVMTAFLFLLLLGAFISPIFSGCFAIFLVFFILSGMLVFISVNFVWILAIGVLFYLGSFVSQLFRWHKLPELSQYLKEHPDCKLNVGISCFNCGSDQLHNEGLFYSKSKWRYYVCKHCGTTLFRFHVL